MRSGLRRLLRSGHPGQGPDESGIPDSEDPPEVSGNGSLTTADPGASGPPWDRAAPPSSRQPGYVLSVGDNDRVPGEMTGAPAELDDDGTDELPAVRSAAGAADPDHVQPPDGTVAMDAVGADTSPLDRAAGGPGAGGDEPVPADTARDADAAGSNGAAGDAGAAVDAGTDPAGRGRRRGWRRGSSPGRRSRLSGWDMDLDDADPAIDPDLAPGDAGAGATESQAGADAAAAAGDTGPDGADSGRDGTDLVAGSADGAASEPAAAGETPAATGETPAAAGETAVDAPGAAGELAADVAAATVESASGGATAAKGKGIGQRLAQLRGSPLARHSLATAARAAGQGQGFTRLTLLPTLLVTAWLLPAIPLLLGGSFALAPMLVISIPVAIALVFFGLRQVPGRWPRSAQAKPGPGPTTPWWAALATAAVAVGFVVWQAALASPAVIVTRDPGVYLQAGYWIAQHGSVSIPASASVFGGHSGLSFASIGFTQHGGTLTAQFLSGLPAVLAAAFWAHGISAAVLVPAFLGGLAILTFAGLVGRLAGPRWAPAGAVVLAVALPEQYTSRSAFSEPLTQILLFGGLCLLIDALCSMTPRSAPSPRATAGRRPSPGWAVWTWRPAPPSQAAVLATLGGLALGLTTVVGVGNLSVLLPAIVVLAVMFAARWPGWIPFGVGLVVGAGYGLADDFVLARSYVDSLSSWTRPFGIIIAALTVVVLDCALIWRYARIGRQSRKLLGWIPFRWLPEAAAGLTVLVLIVFAIRPYVETERDTNAGEIAWVGYLQRIAGLPLNAHRTYAEDTLYWVIWYIGLPALLLGVFGLALLARRVLRALITWEDPAATARLWALPLLTIGMLAIATLWHPGTFPDQPSASRRLVPVVLPGLILAAVWAAAWLTGRSRQRGASVGASALVAAFCVGALLLPTALTTFGVGVASSALTKGTKSTSLASQHTGKGEVTAVHSLCTALGPSAAVVIVTPGTGAYFSQTIRGMCDVPVTQVSAPSEFTLQQLASSVTRAHRHLVLLGSTRGAMSLYGAPREILNLTTTQDAGELTRPATTTWPVHYSIWMTQAVS